MPRLQCLSVYSIHDTPLQIYSAQTQNFNGSLKYLCCLNTFRYSDICTVHELAMSLLKIFVQTKEFVTILNRALRLRADTFHFETPYADALHMLTVEVLGTMRLYVAFPLQDKK